MQKPVFGIVYEYRRGDVHGVYQTKTFLDAAFVHELLNRIGDVYETAPVRNLKPKVFRE